MEGNRWLENVDQEEPGVLAGQEPSEGGVQSHRVHMHGRRLREFGGVAMLLLCSVNVDGRPVQWRGWLTTIPG